MKPADVRAVLKAIEAQRGDDETQHVLEDALHVAVLTAIGQGAERPEVLARTALRSSAIDFQRWCA